MEHGNRKVEYAEKKEIQDGIMKKYHPQEYAELKEAEEATASGGQDQIESELHEPMPEHEKQSDKEKRKTGGSLRPQRRNRSFQEASAEVQSDAQAYESEHLLVRTLCNTLPYGTATLSVQYIYLLCR